MGQGNVDSVKKVMDVVFRAYEAQKKPSAAAPKAKPKAPAIMSASNEADFSERRGVADVSKLGEMSEEQRTQWFIQNRFV
jgi:hypothetical protein